jgi:hypothetical protein
MKPVYVQAVGLVAPGLFGWQASKEVLAGNLAYQQDSLPQLKSDLLKPNERRRISNTIKLVLKAIEDALGKTASDNSYGSVFASSEGDLEILDHICRALELEDKPVSPTHFHNSVHNAPAGYASIASGSRNASTSISGQGGSFSMGLLEAAVQVITNQQQILLVAYDYTAPHPLNEFIRISQPFATALLLSPDSKESSSIGLRLSLTGHGNESCMEDPQLEKLRVSNPAARALPLLQSIALGDYTPLIIPYHAAQNLQIEPGPVNRP